MGHTEVGQSCLAVAADQDVLGLDVAMDDPGGVDRLQSLEHLPDDRANAHRIERRLAVDEVLQVLAVDVLHDDVEGFTLLTEIVDIDHVAVGNGCGGAGFLAESPDIRLVFGEITTEELDRDDAIETLVPAAIGDRRGSLADPFLDHVAVREPVRRAIGCAVT